MFAPSDVSETTPVSAEVVAVEGAERTSPFARPAPRDAYWRHGIILAIATLVLLVAASLSVRGEHEVRIPLLGFSLPELCYWRMMFELPCPGCGLTRCFISLAHGEVARAWQFQPVGCLIFAGVVLQFPYRGWQILRLRRGVPDRAPPWIIVAAWLVVPALFLQWIWRVFA